MGNTISYTTNNHTLDLGKRGEITGVQYDQKAIRYASVPYALPPVGEYRWRKPRALPADYSYDDDQNRPFDGTEFKPTCWQKRFSSAEVTIGEKVEYSEDCLRANIWTPVETSERPKPARGWPVYIWFHGGWFQMGDPSQEHGMSPVELISTGGLNAIVVVVGYRVNVLGFLSGFALLEESNGESVGNYGLWDQRAAMEWIQKYIDAFGGDADNVTLAGRSAGSYSVHAQVLHEFRTNSISAPNARQSPFKRFFMCSNAIPAQPKTPAETQAQYDELLDKLSIDKALSGKEQLRRLRAVSAEDLIDAIATMTNHTFRPVTDDIFLYSGMVEYHSSGTFAEEVKARKCKVLIGEVLNEETLYATYNAPTEPTVDALRTQVQNYYAPATTDRVLENYELPSSSDLKEWKTLFGKIIADGQVRAPSRLFVDMLVKHGVDINDIWRYQIAYRLSFITEKVAPKEFGVAHAMDKPIWNYSIVQGPGQSERKMMGEWIQDLVAFEIGRAHV